MDLQICEEPIFVVGAPRSGTSMMQWAMRQHPDLWGGQESDYLVPLVEALRPIFDFGSQRGRLHWLSGQGVPWEEFLRHIGYGLNSLYMTRSHGKRWVEQTPQYTHHMMDMSTMFPGAVFLFMLRDGRSVVSSLRRFVNPVPHEEACRIWKVSMQSGLDFSRSDLGDRMLWIRYEDIVADTELEMAKIFDFLGLPPERKSVKFITKKSPINSSFQGEESQQKVGPRWAVWSAEERRIFHDVAGDLLIELGFEPDGSWVEADLRETEPAG